LHNPVMLMIALGCDCFWRVSDTHRNGCISAVPPSVVDYERQTRTSIEEPTASGTSARRCEGGRESEGLPATQYPGPSGNEGAAERGISGDRPGAVAGRCRSDQLLCA
jgi:hypothetical protein